MHAGDEPYDRGFADLHCHTSHSFDSLSDPTKVAKAAAQRGLTHLAITDHDRIDGALVARDAAPPELTVIVGEEIRTADGDLIALWIDERIPSGLPADETIERIHAQGGLAGVPHPFDRLRGSAAKDGMERLERLAPLVDYLEAYNSRVPFGSANQQASLFAHQHGLPGIAVSDAHTILEVGISYTVLPRRFIGSAADLRAALDLVRRDALVTQRASLVVRALMPVAKLVQRTRGNGRGVVP